MSLQNMAKMNSLLTLNIDIFVKYFIDASLNSISTALF